MKFKDKNQLVLAISAGLIVLAVLIAIISSAVAKSKVESKTTQPSTASSGTQQPGLPNQGGSNNTVNTTGNNPGKYKVATKNDPLGVRLHPEDGAQRIYELPKGSEIQVVATYGNWAYVQIDGVNGWVALKYLQLVEKGAAPKYSNGTYTVSTKNDPLGIRVKPYQDAERNGQVPKGEKVTVLTVCGEWGYVNYNGNYGWLSFQYLK